MTHQWQPSEHGARCINCDARRTEHNQHEECPAAKGDDFRLFDDEGGGEAYPD
jgi:hypothetical protein